MIEPGTKEFKSKFGIGEKVRDIWKGPYQGSEGYIEKIIIDENGITYEVMITEIEAHEKLHGTCKTVTEIMRPVIVEYHHFMLESIEEEVNEQETTAKSTHK